MKKYNFRKIVAGVLAFTLGFGVLAMPYKSNAQEANAGRSVTVRYIENGNGTNVLKPDVVVTAKTDDVAEEYDVSTPEYVFENIESGGRRYVLTNNVPKEGGGTEKGTFVSANTPPKTGTVTYLYTLVGERVSAIGVDRDGAELFNVTVVEDAPVGSNYRFEIPNTYAKDNVTYNFVEKAQDSADVEGTVTDSPKVIRLIYERNNNPPSGEYTVRDVVEGTGFELGSKTRTDYPFGEALIIENNDYEGYTLVRTDGDTSPLSAETPNKVITNVYREKASTATIRYIDESTGQEIEPQIDKFKDGDEALVAVQKSFPDHKFVRKEGPDGWKIGGHVDITFYYIPKQVFTLTVKHINKATNEPITEESTLSVKEGTNYTTEPLENSKIMTLDAMPANANGTMTENTVVTYFYNVERETASVIVRHLLKGTDTQIRLAESVEAKVGDTTTFSHADVAGYTKASDSVTYTYTRETGIVKLFYEKIPSSLVIQHLDIDTGAELLRDSFDGTVGDVYSTTPGQFSGYKYVSVEGNQNGKYVAGTTYVKYYYKKVVGSLTVSFLDIDTDSQLVDNKVENNIPAGSQYKAKSASIEGYELVEVPENVEGTIIEGNINVIFKYRKTSTDVNTDGTVGNDTTNGSPNIIEESEIELSTPSVGEVIKRPGVEIKENGLVVGDAKQSDKKFPVPNTSDPISVYFLLGGLGLSGALLTRKKKQDK